MINIIDTSIYNLIIKLFSIQTTSIMKAISYFGSATFLILISILLLCTFKNKKIALMIMINLALVYIINVILKNLIARPRPDGLKLVYETGYSFPSGHAMVSTGFYGFLIYIAYKQIKDRKIRNITIISLGLLIFLIGISRVYLGAHYATDVIGGFIVGTLYLIILIKTIGGKRIWKKSLQ